MNDILSRKIVLDLQKWMDRKEIIAIKGPRQAGKTTVMEILSRELVQSGVKEENIVFLTFEDMEILEAFIKDPKSFVKSYVRNEERHYFFFDEYQYVPDGGKKLKLLYDTFHNIKFIISGSSSLELTDKLSKFLVGRVFSFTLYPFDFGEFLEAKDKRLSQIYKEKNKLLRDFLVEGKPFAVKEDIFVNEVLKLFELYSVYG
ncbi:MAG: AAA family ATPase, partial [Candidatus Aenigmarchaeota archaeon]|nr:AAA family ATPase [Candidatus Aenigmarchaeota archaeon]